jgi:uncharacterized protein (TIGR03118 family)
VRLKSRNSRLAVRQGTKRRFRPVVESLEDRCLLDAGYFQTNLVSDGAVPATSTDPNLHNPWGLAAGPSGPFWVSDQGTNVSTLYNGAGQGFPVGSPLVVSIPKGAHAGGFTGPSGIVFNGGSNFNSDIFIFATVDGTIAGWNPGVNFTQAVTAVDHSGTGVSYTGLAINDAGDLIYAANFGTNSVDVFDANFSPKTLKGTFSDPNLPSGFAPYGIQNLNGKLYVTFAPQNLSPGGIVDMFNFDGTPGLAHGNVRLITGGALNLPWGMVIAPRDFGELSGDLLVGNVGDGLIHAYKPKSGDFIGTLSDANGNPIANPGLWGLHFGNGGVAGDSDTLFFNAGINGYADGLFGSIQTNRHAAPSHQINETVIPNLPASPTLVVNSNSPTGDQNPYGIVFVPPGFAQGGKVNPGDILVSNFNNSQNLQGTGSTIMRITPNGQTSVFFQGPQGIGLTTALGVLKSGFVIVGNVPADSKGNPQQGSLLIIDKNGNLVETLSDSALLNGPWDLTINDKGDHAQVFVSNALSGTVTRIDLSIPDGSDPIVESETQIASGYKHFVDPIAFVIGPTGLAYDPNQDILYVASTGDNQIFAIPNAKGRTTDAGMGQVIYQDNVHLHGPLGLLLAPNGDLITANGDSINPDPKQSSEIVEFTPSGNFVGQFQLDPNPDAPFGIALQFSQPGNELNFAAVEDDTNTVHVWTIDVQSNDHGDQDDQGEDHQGLLRSDNHHARPATARPDLFALGKSQILLGSKMVEHLAATTVMNSARTESNLVESDGHTSTGLTSNRLTHRSAVDRAFADALDNLWGRF